MGYIDDTLDERIYEDYLENNKKERKTMGNVNKELEKITSEIGVDKQNAKVMLESLEALTERVSKWEDLAKVKIESEEDEGGMALSKENRLAIKRDRLEIEKFSDAQRKVIQEKKAPLDAQDKAWLKIKQYFEKQAKEYEAVLEEQEKFAENLAKERASKKLAERKEKLSTVCDDVEIYPLDTMTDDAFDKIFQSMKALKEKEEAEAKRLEEERIANEKAEKEKAEAEAEKLAKRNALQRERYSLIEPYAQHGPTVDMMGLAELEEDYFIQVLEKKKESYKVWKVEQEQKEQERLAQARALAEAAEKTRKAQEELNKIKEQEEKARKEKEAQELKERVEAERREKELAKAPDKEKLKLLLNSFTYEPQKVKGKESQIIYDDILTKFEGFIKWAKKEIEKL
jgi:fused signal recognition particle receptor